MRKIRNIILSLVLCFMVLPMNIHAAGYIDMGRDIQLTLQTNYSGIHFDLYHIGYVSETGEISVAEGYEDYNVNITGKNDEAWNELSLTLEGFVAAEGIQSEYNGTTGSDGSLYFDSVEKGLYLVTSEIKTQDGKVYETTPSIILLPSLDYEKNEWMYEVTIEPKFEISDDTSLSLKVMKVWKDTGYEKVRPTSVLVQLYEDGQLYDQVTLSKENNWQHVWENCETTHKYTLVEQKIDNYTVSVTKEGVTYVVTNTYNVPPTPSTDKNIPHTGQYWWPVLALVVVGLLFIVIGLVRRKSNEG